MDITAASTERTIHIRICHHLWIRAFNMYIFKIPGFYECPISWVHFIGKRFWAFLRFGSKSAIRQRKGGARYAPYAEIPQGRMGVLS